MSYIIFTKDKCPNCEKALQLLQLYGAKFRIIELGKDMPFELFKQEFADVTRVPYVTSDTLEFRSLLRLSSHLSEVRNEELSNSERSSSIRRIYIEVEKTSES